MALLILGVPVVSESVTTYNTVAASMFTFWDYLLTFGDEVDLIWRPELSWISVLFYFIRYLTFFIRIVHLVFCTNAFGMVPITAAGCKIWRWFQVLSGQFLFCSVEVLLITRVYAFYGRNNKLLTILVSLLAAEFAAMIYLVVASLPKEVAIPNPIIHIHAAPCVGISQPRIFSSLWVPPLIMQSTLSILIGVRYIQTKMVAQMNRPSVLTVFIRDHTWAFLLIFAVSFFATLAYEVTEHLGEVALTWTYSILGFCGSRLILNLRLAAQERREFSSTVGTEMEFSSFIDPAEYFDMVSTTNEACKSEESKR